VTTTTWPPFLPRWFWYTAFWALVAVVCAPQLYWTGDDHSWLKVFWIEIVFWSSWGILALAVFRLCRRLYEGQRTWQRYVPGLLLGAIGASVLQPLIGQCIQFSRWGLEWSLFGRPDAPHGFLSQVGAGFVRQCGSNPFIFGAVAFAWHAIRYSHDLREKQLRSAELESQLREAKLQALRSQLNPHFLFNTLHSIAELVHEDPPLAEQLIVRLGELLRKVLESIDQQEVPLAEEIEFIKAYLDIEQMRLGSRLNIEWDLSEEAMGLKVPTLLLQPLVENAVQHGIACSTEPGTVRIQARRDNGFLELQVRDSGPGLEKRGQPANLGIGLANTKARLQTIFGDRYRFELLSDHGLSVKVRLPTSG
jgi:hypothetical protein